MSQHVIIIGSGLGGLSCGVMLAQRGLRVTILEQGQVPGGCLQCFERGGVRFDTGMHFVGSADPGQQLYNLLDALEVLPDVTFSRLDTSGYDVINIAGQSFRLANGREAFIEGLLGDFPGAGDMLTRYFDRVEAVAQASAVSTTTHGPLTSLLADSQQTSMGEVLADLLPDEDLRHVVCGESLLYDAQPERTPFSLHAQLMDFYNQSAFRIVGGSDTIAQSLVRTLGRYGGEVLTRQRVTRILSDERCVTGVEVNGSTFMPADVVVGAIHPQTLFPLVEGTLLRPAFRQRVASLANTPGAFSLFLHFRPGAMPYMPSNFFGYSGHAPWWNDAADVWPSSYLYMHACHEAQPQWAQTGVLLSYVSWAEVARWAETHVGRRGADYEAWKEQKAQQLLDAAERQFPGLRQSLAAYYTASPLTYRDYTQTAQGSVYGVAKDVTLGVGGRVSYRTRIPNLFLAGQNVNSHGILGVLVGSLMTSSAIAPTTKSSHA